MAIHDDVWREGGLFRLLRQQARAYRPSKPKRIHVLIDERLDEAVKARAAQEGLTRSALIRLTLRREFTPRGDGLDDPIERFAGSVRLGVAPGPRADDPVPYER